MSKAMVLGSPKFSFGMSLEENSVGLLTKINNESSILSR